MERIHMKQFRFQRGRFTVVLAVITFALMVAPSLGGESIEKESKKPAVPDSTAMKLRGGQEGTLFESLRIEGEDRVRIHFERPLLNLKPEAGSAQGLEWESVHDIIVRSGVDPISPFLACSAGERPARFTRPWLHTFSSGSIARFRPVVEGVDRWRLLVADSKGDTVAVFHGDGKPPKEIAWDGRSLDGSYALPGLIYSYVLEAYDRAGNKRSFLGDGFELPSYRVETDDCHMMLFSGTELMTAPAAYGESTLPPPVLLEVASWMNQEKDQQSPVRIEITARDVRKIKRLADEITNQLEPHLLGNSLRIQQITKIESNAPEDGTVAVIISR